MNIIACVISAHLVIYAGANASRERRYYYRDFILCDPWPGNDNIWYYDYDVYECQFTPVILHFLFPWIFLISYVHT